jgi:light-harvesting complex I chlorophyll a/b binding protein 1
MMKIAAAALLAGSAAAFAPAQQGSAVKSTNLDAMPERMWNTMVDKNERSKSMPFLPRPINLDGSYVGDVGFDPFYLSSIPKNFAGFIQPPSWEETEGLPTLYWMREAELKHGRVAMLAWTGWLATDGALGPVPLRFPGAVYHDVPNSFSAHDIMVEQGSLGFMLFAIGFIEFCTGAVLVEVSKGQSDREAGDFKLDPLNFLKGKSKEEVDTMKLKELQNGRAAMMAFAGVVTQAGLGGTEFPYLVPYPDVASVTW